MDDQPHPETPRKSTDLSSLQGAEPKRKPKGNRGQKADRGSKWNHPFMESDEFSDAKIVVNDKIIYTTKSLLAYHSPVFMKYFKGDSNANNSQGKGGKTNKSSAPSQMNKDIDLSEKSFEDVYDMMAYLDPRVDFTLTDRDAFRLLPLAEEYQMKQIIRAAETTLCQSFFKMRKGRRSGSLPLDTTLQYLMAADRYKYTDLKCMCIDECISNESPNVVRAVTECTELSEPIKVETLKGKLDKVSLALAKERRDKTERENTNSVGQKGRRK